MRCRIDLITSMKRERNYQSVYWAINLAKKEDDDFCIDYSILQGMNTWLKNCKNFFIFLINFLLIFFTRFFKTFSKIKTKILNVDDKSSGECYNETLRHLLSVECSLVWSSRIKSFTEKKESPLMYWIIIKCLFNWLALNIILSF